MRVKKLLGWGTRARKVVYPDSMGAGAPVLQILLDLALCTSPPTVSFIITLVVSIALP